jgi:hypothetical protein
MIQQFYQKVQNVLLGRGRSGTGSAWFLSFWPLQIGGWGLNLLVPVLVLLSGSLTNPATFVYALSRPLNGFLITLALRPFCSRASARYGKRLVFVPGIVLVSLLLSYLDLLVVDRLVLVFALPSIESHAWIAVFFVRMATFIIWLLLYFGIKSIKLDAVIKQEFQQSELKLLRSQVNPHFLFNALATIMAVRKDEAMVSQVTQSLADYLRFSLAQESQDQFKHPLGQEVTALENYLLVEKIRFQEKLETQIEVSAEACAVHVPTALIQPLLENAIKYGQKTSPPPLCIAIEARLEKGRLLLMVENTGRWVEPHGPDSTGFGIANLRKRLHLLYADQAQLTFDHNAAVVRAQVSLPISETT